MGTATKKRPKRNKVDSEKRPLRLEWIDPASLDANPKNWRRHPPEQTAALRDAIGEVGWAGALLYNERTRRLIDGHARKEQFAGQAVPVLVGSWSEADEAKILATLDPVGAMATTDPEAFAALMAEVETGSAAIREMLAAVAKEAPEPAREIVEDVAPEPPAVPITKPGDLWLLGPHRLLCGDSTKAEDVARVMAGERAGLCFTSPPYAQQRDYTAESKGQDWDEMMRGVFGCLPMADDGQVLVNLGLVHRDGEWWPYWDGWIEWMRGEGWRRFGWYVWDQGYGLPGDWGGRFSPSHEWVFHFNKTTIYPERTKPKKPENVREARGTQRYADGHLERKHSPESGLETHKRPDSVIRTFRQQDRAATGGHPAPFSLGFAGEIIPCWPGDTFDPFLGSGTTLIAAHQLNRRCFGLEIAPAYCDVIVNRWHNLTGEKARRA